MPTVASHGKEPRYVVVAPTYNHAGPLRDVLRDLEPLGLPVIVVDDGSADGSDAVLADWSGGNKERVVVRHGKNRGKAAALRSGFDAARELGFTHAMTIDTDGQHDPADLKALMTVSRDHPGSLIVGSRAKRIDGYPLAGRLGRWVSNRLIRWESGVRVEDSQSGMRVYPLESMARIGARAGRYAFETEVLTRAGWAGLRVLEVPITCVYRLPQGRVSHFRIGADTAAAIAMHAALLLRSCLPGDPAPRLDSESPTGTLWFRACRRLRPRIARVSGAGAVAAPPLKARGD